MVKIQFFSYLYQLTIYPACKYGSMIIVDHINVHNIRLIFRHIVIHFLRDELQYFMCSLHNLLKKS